MGGSILLTGIPKICYFWPQIPFTRIFHEFTSWRDCVRVRILECGMRISECIRYKSSICVQESEVRDPKSEILRRSRDSNS